MGVDSLAGLGLRNFPNPAKRGCTDGLVSVFLLVALL